MALKNKTKAELLQEVSELRKKIKDQQSSLKKPHPFLLSQISEKYQILDSISEHVIIQDTKHKIIWANKAAYESVELKKNELAGKICYKVWQNRKTSCPRCPVAKAVKTGKSHQLEMSSPDGRFWEIHGYPLKDNKGRVTGATEITLEITEKKKAEIFLNKEQELLKQISDTSPVAIAVVNIDGKISFANKHAEQVLGLIKNKITQRTYNDPKWKITDYEGNPFPDKKLPFQLVKSTKKPVSDIHHAIEWPDGQRVLLSINAAPLFDEKGKFNGIVAAMEDVTWRVRSERALRESEASMRSLFRAAPIGIGIVINRIFQTVNDSMCRMVGYTKEELIGKSARIVYPNDKEFQRVGEIKYKDIKKAGIGIIETKFKHKNGTILDIFLSSSPIDPRDLSTGVIFTARDITERKQSEQRFQMAAEISSDFIYEWDVGKDTLVWFGDIDKGLGYKSGTIPHTIEGWVNLIHPDDQKRLRNAVKTHRDATTPIYEEYRIRHHDGSWRNWIDRGTPILDHKGHPLKWIGSCIDITKSKQSEMELQTAREEWEDIFQAIGHSALIMDKDHTLIHANKATTKAVGKPEKELIGKKCYEIFHNSTKPVKCCPTEKLISSGKIKTIEMEMEALGGFFLVSCTPIMDAKRKLKNIIHIATDITDRKKAEQELKESEEKYRLFIENIPSVVWLSSQKGTTKYISPNIKQIYGFSPDEIYKTGPKSWLGRIHPEDLDGVKKGFKDLFMKGKAFNVEYRIKHKDGKWIWLSDRASITREIDNTHWALGLFTDITEQKNTEIALRESEKRFKQFFENEPEYCYIISSDGKILDINTAALNVLGYKKEEILDKPVVPTLYASSSRKKAREILQKWKKTGKIRNEILEIKTKKGDIRTILLSVDAVRDIDGKILYSVSVQRDITEQKKAEDKILESEERYRDLVEKAGVAILIDDKNGNFTYFNKEFLKLFGYLKKEIMQKSISTLVHPEDKDRVMKYHQDRLTGKRISSRYEFRGIKKDGSIVFLEVDAVVLKQDGKAIGSRSYIWDITDRKLAQVAVEESEEKFRSIAEYSPNMIFINREEQVAYVNRKCEEVMGYTRKEMLSQGFNFMILISPESQSFIKENFRKHSLGEDINPYEYNLLTKKGKKINALITTRIIQYQGENAILGIITDITERKKTEDQIKASLKEKEVLLKEIHHRVKNNMQIMSSLLRLQTRRIHDPLLNEKLERYHDRIKSMALIHERLYQSEDLGHINFADYTNDLISYLRLSYGSDHKNIIIGTEIKDIFLDVNVAIPCGLIINELVSNSLKHAFTGRDTGEVLIRFMSPEINKYTISVKDNGVGFPDDIDYKNPESLGLQLVNDLVKQIKGKLALDVKEGSTFTVTF